MASNSPPNYKLLYSLLSPPKYYDQGELEVLYSSLPEGSLWSLSRGSPRENPSQQTWARLTRGHVLNELEYAKVK